MAVATYCSTLDAASAYWSMLSNELDREKTVFPVPRGKFEFKVCPYGLCNAGASYQHLWISAYQAYQQITFWST